MAVYLKDRVEAVCQCADQRIACGSDNTTYETTCIMYRVKNNRRVTLQHWGPCRHGKTGKIACGKYT